MVIMRRSMRYLVICALVVAEWSSRTQSFTVTGVTSNRSATTTAHRTYLARDSGEPSSVLLTGSGFSNISGAGCIFKGPTFDYVVGGTLRGDWIECTLSSSAKLQLPASAGWTVHVNIGPPGSASVGVGDYPAVGFPVTIYNHASFVFGSISPTFGETTVTTTVAFSFLGGSKPPNTSRAHCLFTDPGSSVGGSAHSVVAGFRAAEYLCTLPTVALAGAAPGTSKQVGVMLSLSSEASEAIRFVNGSTTALFTYARPGPEVVAVSFTEGAASLKVTFDNPVVPRTSNCTDVWDAHTISTFGTTPTCTWVSTRSTRIMLGTTPNVSTLMPVLHSGVQTVSGGLHRIGAAFWLALSQPARLAEPEGQALFGLPNAAARLRIAGPRAVAVCATDSHLYTASWVLGLGHATVIYSWTLSTAAGIILHSVLNTTASHFVATGTVLVAEGIFQVDVSAIVSGAHRFTASRTITTISGDVPSEATLRMPQYAILRASQSWAITATVILSLCNRTTRPAGALLTSIVNPDYTLSVSNNTTTGLILSARAGDFGTGVEHTVRLSHVVTGQVMDTATIFIVNDKVSVSIDGGAVQSFTPRTVQCLVPRLIGAVPTSATVYWWTCDLCTPVATWNTSHSASGGTLCADFSATTSVASTISVRSTAPESHSPGAVEIRDQIVFTDNQVTVSATPTHQDGGDSDIRTVYAVVDLTVVDQAVSGGTAVWTARLANGTTITVNSISNSTVGYTIVGNGVVPGHSQIGTGATTVLALDITMNRLDVGNLYTVQLTVTVNRVLSGASAIAWAGATLRALDAPRSVSERGNPTVSPASGDALMTAFTVQARGFLGDGPMEYVYSAKGSLTARAVLLCISSRSICTFRLPTDTTHVGVKAVGVNSRAFSDTTWLPVSLSAPGALATRQAASVVAVEALWREAQTTSGQNFAALLARMAPLSAELRSLTQNTPAVVRVEQLLLAIGPMAVVMQSAAVNSHDAIDQLVGVARDVFHSAASSNVQNVSALQQGSRTVRIAVRLLTSSSASFSRDAVQVAMDALAVATTLGGNPGRTQADTSADALLDDYNAAANLIGPLLCDGTPRGETSVTSWGGAFANLEDAGTILVHRPLSYPRGGLILEATSSRGASIRVTSSRLEADLASNAACSVDTVAVSGCNWTCISVAITAFDTLTPSNSTALFSKLPLFAHELISAMVDVDIRGAGAAHSTTLATDITFFNTVPTRGSAATIACFQWHSETAAWGEAAGSVATATSSLNQVTCNVTGAGTFGVFQQCPAGLLSLQCDSPCQNGTWGVACANAKTCEQGVVVDKASGVCPCPSGYTGDTCEFLCNGTAALAVKGFPGFGVNCSSRQLCADNSTLSYSAHTGVCNCAAGFSGTYCSIDLPECSPNPCTNGGVCTENGVLDYTCTCPGGVDASGQTVAHYSGKNCTTNVDDCPAVGCQNTAVCTDCVGGFACAVPMTADPCSRAPFLSTSTAASSTCSGGNYNCNRGMTGTFCEAYCPDNCFGAGCGSPCTCRVGGVCNAIDGSCTYAPIAPKPADHRWKIYVSVAVILLLLIAGGAAVYYATTRMDSQHREALITRIRKSQTELETSTDTIDMATADTSHLGNEAPTIRTDRVGVAESAVTSVVMMLAPLSERETIATTVSTHEDQAAKLSKDVTSMRPLALVQAAEEVSETRNLDNIATEVAADLVISKSTTRAIGDVDLPGTAA